MMSGGLLGSRRFFFTKFQVRYFRKHHQFQNLGSPFARQESLYDQRNQVRALGQHYKLKIDRCSYQPTQDQVPLLLQFQSRNGSMFEQLHFPISSYWFRLQHLFILWLSFGRMVVQTTRRAVSCEKRVQRCCLILIFNFQRFLLTPSYQSVRRSGFARLENKSFNFCTISRDLVFSSFAFLYDLRHHSSTQELIFKVRSGQVKLRWIGMRRLVKGYDITDKLVIIDTCLVQQPFIFLVYNAL